MWQEIAVLIIGLIVIFHIGKFPRLICSLNIFRHSCRDLPRTFLLPHPTQTYNPCQGCPGCALKTKSETTMSDSTKNMSN